MTRRENQAQAAEIIEELLVESDRGLALICAEHLSSELEVLLRAKLAIKRTADLKKIVDPMFRSGTGAMHSFSARIKFAYVFGWIPSDVFGDLERIRSIRNDFAHSSGKLRFTTQSMAARVKMLMIGHEFESLLMFLQSHHSTVLRLPAGSIGAERAAFLGATIFIRAELRGLAGLFGTKWKPETRSSFIPRWEKLQAQLDAQEILARAGLPGKATTAERPLGSSSSGRPPKGQTRAG